MKRPEKTNQEQKFIKKAKELGCDENSLAFEENLRKVATSRKKAGGNRGKEKQSKV